MRLYDTHKWRELRKQILRENPLCVRCSNMGITSIATVIDHCIPAREYEDFFDTLNLFPVCTQCHSDVTKHFDNRNAHKIFNENYANIKYSGDEFRVSEIDGWRVNPELDEKLLSLPIIDVKKDYKDK